MRGVDITIVILAILLVITIGLWIFTPVVLLAPSGTTESRVTIDVFYAIDLSSALLTGIDFGNIVELPASDVNGSDNYGGPSSETLYNVIVATDSNTAVDFCINANSALSDDFNNQIPLVGETYLNASTTDATTPGPVGDSVSLSTTAVKASDVNSPGDSTHYRFWLDVPSVPVGFYNNTVTFTGVITGNVCP